MSWTDWPKFAYIHKLCLINWPVKAVAPGQTDEKYDIKKKSNGVPQQCLTNSNTKRREDPESDDPACIRIISWDTEDLELDTEDNNYIEIPLKKKKRKTLKDKLTPTLYESRKFLPKNINFIDLNTPDPISEATTHAKQACANNTERECTPQKKSHVDNDVPGPSKPKKKMHELTAVAGPSTPKKPCTEVAGPSKQFEMTPEMLAAIAQLVKSMQPGDDNTDNST
ncbi:hypothetical protein DXG01_010332 [Tephrocybe rancida]|nr:hypothetical protein DXG01_010332 [Tephrocybe rancida]